MFTRFARPLHGNPWRAWRPGFGIPGRLARTFDSRPSASLALHYQGWSVDSDGHWHSDSDDWDDGYWHIDSEDI